MAQATTHPLLSTNNTITTYPIDTNNLYYYQSTMFRSRPIAQYNNSSESDEETATTTASSGSSSTITQPRSTTGSDLDDKHSNVAHNVKDSGTGKRYDDVTMQQSQTPSSSAAPFTTQSASSFSKSLLQSLDSSTASQYQQSKQYDGRYRQSHSAQQTSSHRQHPRRRASPDPQRSHGRYRDRNDDDEQLSDRARRSDSDDDENPAHRH